MSAALGALIPQIVAILSMIAVVVGSIMAFGRQQKKLGKKTSENEDQHEQLKAMELQIERATEPRPTLDRLRAAAKRLGRVRTASDEDRTRP